MRLSNALGLSILLLPVLALMGFIAGEREIGGMLARDPGLLARTMETQARPAARPELDDIAAGIRIALFVQG